MAENIKEYRLKDGKRRFMFKTYLGIHPYSKERVETTRRGFKSSREASIELARLKTNWLDEIEKEMARKKKKKTYEQIYDLWIEEYKTTVKESTLYKTEQLFDNHILPAFGSECIEDIKPLAVQEIMNEWHDKFAKASTIMNYAGLVFDYALRLQIITINPTKIIRKPSKIKKVKSDEELNFYDKEELKEFMESLSKGKNKRAFVYFRLLAFTGIRKGEAGALQWSDIDFKNKVLNINKAVSRKATGLYIQTPKTTSSVRRISLDDKTLEILEEFKDDDDDNLLIFRSDDNSILSPAKSRKWLIFAQDQLDKQREKPMKRISTHGFRHTHASLLFESGATLKDVQYRLGHSDIQTTMDIYTHVTKQAKEQLAERFNEYIDF